MFRKRLAWFVCIVTTAMLAVMLLGVGGSQAKTPGWTIDVGFPDPTAAVVKQGAAAAWTVTITNTGKSNISLVTMTTDIKASTGLQTPLYISDAVWTNNQSGPVRPCGSAPYSGALSCNFGAMASRDPDVSVTLTIAFPTSSNGTSYSFNFLATGNGNTGSDGGTSHGDTLKGAASVGLHSSSDPDFTGGFSLPGGDTFGTGTTLTASNPQSSSVKSPQFFGINLSEDLTFTDTGFDDPCSVNTCIGQWAHLKVGTGTEGPIKITLLIRGNGIPGNIGADDIGFWHAGDGLMTNLTSLCTSDTTPAVIPCVHITKVGNNFQIIAWLAHNGGGRGMF